MQTAEPQQEKTFVAPKKMPVYEFLKRFFDLTLSLLAMIPFALIYICVAIAVKIEDGGPVIYSSTRLTKGGKPFKMYKFRSMYPDADKRLEELLAQNEMKGPAFKMAKDPRVTKVGRFIRKTSIDETPQLLNIIKGDMTIVGPRPPLPREVEQYNEYQMHRLDVKTGLACYHECSGRNDNPDFEQWVESDLKYIQERGPWTDLKIFFMTIWVVITGKGAW